MEADDDAKIVAWLETNLAGDVVSWERQPRWRPMWFVEMNIGGETRHVVMRGVRADAEQLDLHAVAAHQPEQHALGGGAQATN